MASRQRAAKEVKRRSKPATTPEAREQQLAALAYDLAEEQIRNGSASSQVISQCLKFGSTREQLEQQKIRHENELSQVKKEQIESQKRVEELYIGALDAMREYSGAQPETFDDDED
jgi:hypothetical protein